MKTLSWEHLEIVVENIKKYFADNVKGKGRINLVGGEPMIYPRLQELIDKIVQHGMECSLVTNGSLLTRDFIEHNREKLSMIGISIDSLSDSTNRKIGRCDALGHTMAKEDLIERCRYIRAAGIQLKINTVYSKLNAKEDLREFLRTVQPQRMKLFQMLIVKGVNDSSAAEVISELAFQRITAKYANLGAVVESSDLMTNSYVIVNSSGELLDKENQGEHIVGSLIFQDLKSLIDRSSIIIDKFDARYQTSQENQNDIV
jgi:radical S-adenosyl methionine domain-containing protein 2